MAAEETSTTVSAARAGARVWWLDGVRGAAALFVVCHHIWLTTYGGFPHDNGPWLLGWLLYGHLGVAVFIVVSGYSLSLRPQRHGNRLPTGSGGFFSARAWRILPPYWAAIVVSVLLLGSVGLKSIAVNALLLQDVMQNTSPNGAFWSIAIEAQIYVLFPLLLWLFRRHGPWAAVATVTVLVTACHVAALRLSAFHRVEDFTPQLLVLFVFGMCAATPAVRRLLSPVSLPLALGLTTLGVAVIVAIGPEATVRNYYGIDLLFGLAFAVCCVHMTNRPASVGARLLDSRVAVAVGTFSFSLYLIHVAVIGWLKQHVVFAVRPVSPGWSFTLLAALALPASLLVARLFYVAFERPFFRRRSWAAWAPVLGVRPLRARKSPLQVDVDGVAPAVND